MGCASHLAHVLTILSHVWNIPSFAQGWSTLELGWPGSIFPQTYGKPSFPHTFYHEWWVFHVYVDFLELVTWSYNLCNSEISLDVPSREPRIVLLQQHLKMLGKHQNLRVQNIFVSHEIAFLFFFGGGRHPHFSIIVAQTWTWFLQIVPQTGNKSRFVWTCSGSPSRGWTPSPPSFRHGQQEENEATTNQQMTWGNWIRNGMFTWCMI